jgi:transposase
MKQSMNFDFQNAIKEKYIVMRSILDEKQRRLWASVEAISLGVDGVKIVKNATGISQSTIYAGIQELKKGNIARDALDVEIRRTRRPGAGRPRLEEEDPSLKDALERLVEPTTRGDPMQSLLWTCKSTKNIALELKKKGYSISDRTVARLLHELGYSLQANLKSINEGKENPNRDSQFQYINRMIAEFQKSNDPVVSIDAKKKELIGNFKNSGQEWHLIGKPVKVNDHDFPTGEMKKATPYGIFDLTWNTGWVNVGTDHDTAEFAVESLRKWWLKMGRQLHPNSNRILITADSGGSNSSRGRLWKAELQKWANEIGMQITVCHLPPGTSKWNKIEHRLFCHITRNWRARPLTSYEVVVNLIGSTTTKTGLKVISELDPNVYPPGKKVSKGEMEAINIKFHSDHVKWNYTISPQVAQGETTPNDYTTEN